MKREIRQFGYDLGADVVGFAAVQDYVSAQSPEPRTILSGVQSMVVLGYREIHGALESQNPPTGSSG